MITGKSYRLRNKPSNMITGKSYRLRNKPSKKAACKENAK